MDCQSNPVQYMVAMCFDNYLYATICGPRHEITDIYLPTRMQMRLRIFQEQQTARFGGKQRYDDWKRERDTEPTLVARY